MNVFFDTSVLVAGSEHGHPHYAQARPALVRVAAWQDNGFMGLHSLGEVFAALTRLPVHARINPAEAARIVTENILPHFEVISLGKEAMWRRCTRWQVADGSKREFTTSSC